MRPEERVDLVAKLLLNHMSAVENRLPSKFRCNKGHELPRLGERHLIARGVFVVESDKSVSVRIGCLQEIGYLLSHIRISPPMVGTPKQSGLDSRRPPARVFLVPASCAGGRFVNHS